MDYDKFDVRRRRRFWLNVKKGKTLNAYVRGEPMNLK
jgi:hypothetical protein